MTHKIMKKAHSVSNKQQKRISLDKSKKNQHPMIQGEKAYKLLALQENISSNKAKELIDKGCVSIKGKRLEIARAILPINTKFHILKSHSKIIFEDENILALDKSIGIESYNLIQNYPSYKLINRLDRDTSGIILIAKNEEMRQKAIQEFKHNRVKKTYFAMVEGKLIEDTIVNKNILTQKGNKAKSRIAKHGLEALSIIKPLRILAHTTLVEITIVTGRTHQIRIHLASIKHPIIGDIIYNKNSKIPSKRLMLHCHATSILHYNLESACDIDKTFDIEALTD